MGDKPQVISHHCMGYFTSEDSLHRAYFNCFEGRQSGKMFLQEDHRPALIVDFCPFCGKESAAHLAKKQAEVSSAVPY